jgi:NAD(P)-dependent dehydrogenase (short-subunit alcohol dehydrogenase family)
MSPEETVHFPQLNLGGKVAWVTGGARGIGRAIAIALARAGADVAVVDIDAGEAASVADEVRGFGRRALVLSADVSDSGQVDQMAGDVVDNLGRLDVAVNNAGILVTHAAADCTDEQWRRVMGTNLNGVFWCCRAAGRRLIAQGGGGRIINIGSMSAQVADWPRSHCSYSVSKAGVVMLTRYLAVEWGPHAITVNSISPGNTETDMTARMEEFKPRWREETPLKRLAKPEEIAGAAVYLASDAASYVSGHDLVMDGAYVCA